jgi:hypothetical protein
MDSIRGDALKKNPPHPKKKKKPTTYYPIVPNLPLPTPTLFFPNESPYRRYCPVPRALPAPPPPRPTGATAPRALPVPPPPRPTGAAAPRAIVPRALPASLPPGGRAPPAPHAIIGRPRLSCCKRRRWELELLRLLAQPPGGRSCPYHCAAAGCRPRDPTSLGAGPLLLPDSLCHYRKPELFRILRGQPPHRLVELSRAPD